MRNKGSEKFRNLSKDQTVSGGRRVQVLLWYKNRDISTPFLTSFLYSNEFKQHTNKGKRYVSDVCIMVCNVHSTQSMQSCIYSAFSGVNKRQKLTEK